MLLQTCMSFLFFLLSTKEDILRNGGKQTVDGSHWFTGYGKNIMEDNGDQKLFGYTDFFYRVSSFVFNTRK